MTWAQRLVRVKERCSSTDRPKSVYTSAFGTRMAWEVRGGREVAGALLGVLCEGQPQRMRPLVLAPRVVDG